MQINVALIELCKKGDRAAQKSLYVKTLPYLRAVIVRYLRDLSYTKDVLQEGYINIFKNINKYDSFRAPFEKWAAKICINVALNYNKRVICQPHKEIDKIGDEHLIVVPEDLDSLSEKQLIKLLKFMPFDYYKVFNMYVIEEYTHKEIADQLGIKETLSRKRLSRAKDWLQKHFEKTEYTIQTNLKLPHNISK